MTFRNFSDDFFTIGNLAVLQRMTHNGSYDFDFRNHFDCKSVFAQTDAPVLLHIGAVENYAEVEKAVVEMGMKLLIPEQEHLKYSTIERWYPMIQERTPFTRVYDALPSLDKLGADFSFPIFVKGNRQTSRHDRSKCIIETAEAYEKLQQEWNRDSILSWQKVAVREYVPLQPVQAESYPGQVPISYEFRFFYANGRCVGYGQYWHTDSPYTLQPEDYEAALSTADWAAERLGVVFAAIDLAKTASGQWIIIEVNDGQESGFAELNPISLWNRVISTLQD